MKTKAILITAALLVVITATLQSQGSFSWRVGGHAGGISASCVSSDGRYLATAGYDTLIRIWSIPDGRLQMSFRGHSSLVRVLVFSPDGSTLATGSGDVVSEAKPELFLWNVANGSHKTVMLNAALHGISGLAYSGDGTTLAVLDDSLELVSPSTMLSYRTLPACGMGTAHLAISQDGARVAAVDSRDSMVYEFSVGTGSSLNRYPAVYDGKPARVSAITYSPDGNTLAVGENLESDQNRCLFWPTSGEQVPRILGPFASNLTSIAFSADGKYIALGATYLLPARIFDIARLSLQTTHSGLGYSQLTFTDGANKLVGNSETGMMIWTPGATDSIAEIPIATEAFGPMALSPTGSELASFQNGYIEVRELPSGRFLRSLGPVIGGGVGLTFANNGTEILALTKNPYGSLGGAQRYTISKGDRMSYGTNTPQTNTLAAALSSNGEYAATIETPFDGSYALQPDSARLVIRSLLNDSILWARNVRNGARLMTFSPNGATVALGNNDSTISVWNVITAETLCRIPLAATPTALALSGDGARVYAGLSNGSVVWANAASGYVMRTIPAHLANVNALSLINNDSLLATAGDGLLRFWNTATQLPTYSIDVGTAISGVQVSADMRSIALTFTDATLAFWQGDIVSGIPFNAENTLATDEITAVLITPNPARAPVNISFASSRIVKAHIDVVNASGTIVKELYDAPISGTTVLSFDAKSLAHGDYFVRIRTDHSLVIRPLTVL